MKLRSKKPLSMLLLVVALAAMVVALPERVAAAPAPPTLLSPVDGSAVSTLRPTVSWAAATGATKYSADIADNANMWGVIFSSGFQNILSFTPPADLSTNKLYYWRVKALDSSSASSESAVWRCWMPLTLVSPANGASVSSLTPTLDWSDYKTGMDTTTRSYTVQIASDAGFSAPVVDTMTTASTYGMPSGVLALGQTYYWHVRVTSAEGTSGWSETRSFTTPPAAPNPPALLSPSNGSTVDGWRPTLTWQSTPNATSYKLYYTNTSTGVTSVRGPFSQTSYLLDTYGAEDVTVQWWVEAGNTTGWSGPSAIWSFTTPASQTPPAPTLQSPPNSTTTPVSSLRPSFNWLDTSYTNYYRIEIGKRDMGWGLADVVLGKNVNDSAYVLNNADLYYPMQQLEYNTVYHWKVTSYSLRGLNSTSAIWAFKTPPPPGPGLVSPANSATMGTRRPTLTWSAVEGAQRYQLQVTSSEAFVQTQMVVDVSLDAGLGASYTLPSDIAFDTIYYWRVRFSTTASDDLHWSLWSDPWRFKGPPPPIPFVPTLQSPGSASGLQIVGFGPLFEWTDSSGAASYGFQLATDGSFANRVVDVAGLVSSSYTLGGDLLPNTTYHWRANASNGSGTSEWSTVYLFTTPPPPPVAPTLLEPSAGAALSTLRPHFDWSDPPGATSYTVELYTDAGLLNLAVSANVSGSGYDPQADLAADVTYYWRVRAATEASGPGPWSAAIHFKTPAVPPPGTPILVSPANGEVIDILTPTLDWQDASNAAGYRVQISKLPDFSSLVSDGSVSESIYVRPSWSKLVRDTLYHWRVSGTNAVGQGSWSETRSFRTPATPTVPALVSPADGASVSTVRPTLVVSNVAGATSYMVQLSRSQWSWSSSSIAAESTSSSPEAPVTTTLSYGTTYYWHARANNGADSSAWSATWRFTTPPPPPPPAAPTLQTPTNGSVVGSARPTLDWNDVSGVTKYRLEWTKSPTFAWTESVRDNLTLSIFTMDVDLLYDTQYYWRVRATGEGGDGLWSSIFGLRTPSGPPAVPVLLSPADGANSDSPQQKLDWADASAAESYRVQLSTSATFEVNLVDTTVNASEYTLGSPLATNVTYFWRVKGVNGVGESDWSASWSFVVPAPPGAVTLVAPENGITMTTLRPTFDWEDLAGVASYEVRYSRSDIFAWGVTTANTMVSEHKVATNLPLDVDFFWQVRAKNGGGIGPWSALRRFHTPSTPPPATEPPAVPTLGEPADGAWINTVTPTLTWNAADGANGYHVQICRDNSFITLASNDYTSQTSHTLANALDYSTLYYWRIRAANNIGATNSAVRSFTTPAPPPPPAPQLLQPADGTTVDSLSPVFDWADVPWANGYRIQLSAAHDFSYYVANATVAGGSTYSLPSWIRLAHTTTYYWRVQSYNNASSGDWSMPATFRTADPPPPPPVPVLDSPGSAAAVAPTIDTLKPVYTWKPSAGATSYRIQVSRNSTFSWLAVNSMTSETSYSLPWSTLNKGTQYWWRVQATNAQGTSGWSEVFSFVTPSAPGIPTLLVPSDRSTVNELRPTLQWSVVEGATNYHLAVANNPWFGPKVVDTDVVGTSFTLAFDLVAGGTYYWRVNASNGAGAGGTSATWRFIVAGSPGPEATPTPTPLPTATPGAALSAPVLRSPGAAGSTPIIGTLKPEYRWNPVDGATSYRIQLSRNASFTSLVTNTTTAGTSYSVPWSNLSTGTQYWWRVMAMNSAGASDWSQVFSFATPSKPAVPTLVSPIGSAAVGSLMPVLDWNDVEGATTYQLMVSTTSWFGSKVVNVSVPGGSSFSLGADLVPGTRYYWKVNAGNAAGTSNWSVTESFVTPASL